MPLKMDEVSIRCMGCSQPRTLEEAARSGWKMCKFCNFAICSFCYENLGESRKCFSFPCATKGRNLDAIPLPIETILIFAEEHAYRDYRKGLLYKLFYEEEEQKRAGPVFTIKELTAGQIAEEEKPTKVQEEVWKNYQLVITKRKGGKFITWEKVY